MSTINGPFCPLIEPGPNIVAELLTYKLPPMPAPPATCRAPVAVEDAAVVPGTITLVAVNVVPLNVNPELNAVAPALV